MGRYVLGGRSVGSLADAEGVDALLPFSGMVKLTKGQAIPEGLRGLWVGTAGTANFTPLAGPAVTDFPLLAGYNPVLIKVLAVGGTANDIWACF